MSAIIFRYFRFLLILLIALLSGCWLTQKDSTGFNTNVFELLQSGVYGSRTLQESSATWINNSADLEQIYAALNKHQMGNNSTLPDIDFELFGVLLLEMGQRPTGGYAIHFDPALSRVVDKKAGIHVNWKTPADGMLLTQALTSPFLLLKIPKADIVSILVFDSDKEPLFEISVP